MSGFFIKAWIEKVASSALLPQAVNSKKTDLEIILNTFLLEKALVHLNYELNKRPAWTIVPLRIITSILNSKEIPNK